MEKKRKKKENIICVAMELMRGPTTPAPASSAAPSTRDRAPTVSSRGRGAIYRSIARTIKRRSRGGGEPFAGAAFSLGAEEGRDGRDAASLLILDTRPVTLTAARIALDERNITRILRPPREASDGGGGVEPTATLEFFIFVISLSFHEECVERVYLLLTLSMIGQRLRLL